MKAASCFSGIGAPELGGPQFDWVWCAEVEKFPSAVLAKRFPQSVNLGDVTADDFLQRASAFGPLDLLVGGPPCQDFSVAGLRAGVAGDRGNLSLRFMEIAHAIRPRNLLVENVPGWLNMPDNAFGCFLGALVGADDALRSPLDGKWPGAGMVAGPRARAAWRVFDAQYFGVAQRRRRVFVVADFGEGADPAAVLFERKGVSGNTPPRREAGQGTAGAISARTQGGGGLGTDFEIDGGLAAVSTFDRQSSGEYGDAPVASTVSARDYKGASDLIAHSLRGEGFDASEDGTGRGTPIVPVAIQAGALRENPNSGPDGVGVQSDIAYTIEARAEVQAVAFAQNQRYELRTLDVAGALAAEPGMKQTTYVMTEPVAWSIMPQNSGKDFKARAVDIAQPVMAAGPVGGNHGGDYIQHAWQVRRLTPTECERLQSFPDGFTDIEYRGKRAADGPRYKALGNSWAASNGAWIIARIAERLEQRSLAA